MRLLLEKSASRLYRYLYYRRVRVEACVEGGVRPLLDLRGWSYSGRQRSVPSLATSKQGHFCENAGGGEVTRIKLRRCWPT